MSSRGSGLSATMLSYSGAFSSTGGIGGLCVMSVEVERLFLDHRHSANKDESFSSLSFSAGGSSTASPKDGPDGAGLVGTLTEEK